MTFNQIKYFVTVAECLSFTEAAKCLFITQPALSRQINAMEEELGTRLFIREKKRLKLTPGGSVLYNRLPKVLSDYAEAVEERHCQNTDITWNCLNDIIKVDVCHICQHVESYDYQCRSGREGRDGKENRG